MMSIHQPKPDHLAPNTPQHATPLIRTSLVSLESLLGLITSQGLTPITPAQKGREFSSAAKSSKLLEDLSFLPLFDWLLRLSSSGELGRLLPRCEQLAG